MAVSELAGEHIVISSIDDSSEGNMFYGVKLTGVPRDATENDVRQFFNECTPTEVVICDGGNVFVQLNSQQEFEKACIKDGHQLRWTKVGVLAVTNREEFARGISDDSNDTAAKGDNDDGSKEDEKQYNVIRLRGLPYSATGADVMNFLKGVTIDKGEKGVHFSSGSYGRSTGEVFVEVCSSEDVSLALKYDREHMGGRYIEIFRSSRAQLEWECRGAEKSGGSGGVVRLRGLPYGCSADDIRDFLKGIAIIENGITIQFDETGRETGEAFIEVETDKDVEKALDRHKKSIGHRYIEVFRTTRGDIRPVANRWASYSRPSPYPVRGRGYDGPRGGPGGRYGGRGRGGGGGMGRGGGGNYGGSSYGNDSYQYGHYEDSYYQGNQGGGGGGGRNMGGGGGNMVSYPGPVRSNEPGPHYSGSAGRHAVRMRGLPFSVTIRDIQNFFAPLIPINIMIERDEGGRLSGEGEVSFGSHNDAVEAMRKDRSHIGSRYIELFLHSKNDYDQGPGPSHQQNAYEPSWSNDAPYASYSNPDPRSGGHTSQPPAHQQYSSSHSYQPQQHHQQSTVYNSQPQQYGGSAAAAETGGAGHYISQQQLPPPPPPPPSQQQQGTNTSYSQHHQYNVYQTTPNPQQHQSTGGAGYGYGTQQAPAAGGGGTVGGGGRWY